MLKHCNLEISILKAVGYSSYNFFHMLVYYREQNKPATFVSDVLRM